MLRKFIRKLFGRKDTADDNGEKKRRFKGMSVQDLCRIETFTPYGLNAGKDEFLYFTVAPTNISVLSVENIELKIRNLTNVLTAVPELQVFCTDSSECFDDNKIYLQQRAAAERNYNVRDLLEKDGDMLDEMQTETATARQFLFLLPLRGMKPEQVFQTANRVEKVIADQGFELRRADKEQIKRVLSQYFETAMNGDRIPDVDGGQYFNWEG